MKKIFLSMVFGFCFLFANASHLNAEEAPVDDMTEMGQDNMMGNEMIENPQINDKIQKNFEAQSSEKSTRATAKLVSTADPNLIFGDVTVISVPKKGLMINAILRDVPAAGIHAIHIHEKGSCDDVGKAAGGHYNPANSPHGLYPRDGAHGAHLGDMGNIEVKPSGVAVLARYLPNVYLSGDVNNVSGLAIILHEKQDDFGQPTGNAGGRIGCGVIQLTTDEMKSADPNQK